MIDPGKRVLSFVLAAAMALPLAGADEKKEKPKLPPELEQVYGFALAAPPEFASNALLRISSVVAEKELRRGLIEMAFRLAAGAHHPYRLEPIPNIGSETTASSLWNALRMGFDSLTLQSRAVIQMLPIDPARGRELFLEIPRPAPGVATCESALLPETSAYYDAIGAVSHRGFSGEERSRTEHISFVIGALTRIRGIRELAPAARLIASLDWPPDRFAIAVGTFSTRLEGMPVDSRSFMASANTIEDGIALLVPRIRQSGAVAEPLLNAYRKFLVTQFQAARCADAVPLVGRFVQGSQRMELFGEDIRGDLPPLSPEEMAPAGPDGEAKAEAYWESENAQRIFQEAMRLRQGSDGINYTETTRRSREWTRQLSDFLTSLAGWKASDESSEALYFHQKAFVYESLLELAPPGDTADMLIANFVSFLKNSAMQQRSPVEWYWHARSTLDRVRNGNPDKAAKLASAYRASGSIILVLDDMLDQAAPRDVSRLP